MSIRLYNGYGSCSRGTAVLFDEFQRAALPVRMIGEQEIRETTRWKNETSHIVFSGQSVGQFKKALGADGLESIRSGISQGRFNYIGICAGAAFGACEIYYRMSDDTRTVRYWKANEGLRLFNGVAIGPVKTLTPAYTGQSDNLSVISLYRHKTGQTHKTAYWGGPALLPFPDNARRKLEPISVLPGIGLPMSLRFNFGKGSVTLCSYHPEMTPDNIDYWTSTGTVSPQERRRLDALGPQLDPNAFRYFLEDCGLSAP